MSNSRRIARIALNYVLPILVFGCVGWYFYQKLADPKLRDFSFTLRFEWLIPAGLLYLVAHTIWASFWVTLLRGQKAGVRWDRGIAVYFVSQLGKYIPGKVWVIVIRITMLGRDRVDKLVVGVTASFEAITAMAAGAFLAAVLLPLFSMEQTGGLGWKIYLIIPLILMPLGLRGLNRLLRRIANKRRPPGSPPWPWISVLLLLRGLVQASVGWALLGVSLWMVIQGLSSEDTPLTWVLLGKLIAINGLAYVVGFLFLFMPAGAGVREAFLQVMLAYELQSTLGDTASGFAAVVAIGLRLLWTCMELICAGTLYATVPAPKSSQES